MAFLLLEELKLTLVMISNGWSLSTLPGPVLMRDSKY